MSKKKRSEAQQDHDENPDYRERGRFSVTNPCEMCGKSAGVEYCSDERTNVLGCGLVLCKSCAVKAAGMTDDELKAACWGED